MRVDRAWRKASLRQGGDWSASSFGMSKLSRRVWALRYLGKGEKSGNSTKNTTKLSDISELAARQRDDSNDDTNNSSNNPDFCNKPYYDTLVFG